MAVPRADWAGCQLFESPAWPGLAWPGINALWGHLSKQLAILVARHARDPQVSLCCCNTSALSLVFPSCCAAGIGTTDSAYSCSFLHKSQGYCRPVTFADGCAMVQSALVGGTTCTKPDRAYPGGEQFGWFNGPSSRCIPVTYRCARGCSCFHMHPALMHHAADYMGAACMPLYT